MYTPPAAALRPEKSVAVIPPMRRTYEVAALRADDTQSLFQVTGTAYPHLDTAFSAFARGALLSAPGGRVAIEDLQPGDMLNTSTGAPAEVVWIGSTTFTPRVGLARPRVIRIMADTFGPARPGSFVTVGPSARILQTPSHLRALSHGAPLLTPVDAFIDNENVIEVTPPTAFQMFHLCLSRHAAIDVGGIEMETYHPGNAISRQMSHAQRDFFISLFPRVAHLTDFGPLAHPRAPEPETLAA